jgi:hypothetical protein
MKKTPWTTVAGIRLVAAVWLLSSSLALLAILSLPVLVGATNPERDQEIDVSAEQPSPESYATNEESQVTSTTGGPRQQPIRADELGLGCAAE